ncbi:BatD family protein, partial [Candidatus Woesearchaeota archaeon]|nr:BatD family protein [Candidatus Woesearchaeota archaeon]
DIEYIVENNEDEEPAYNIVLHFPLQQDTDVIGLENFTINELSHGERIVLTDVGKIRPKFARETDVTEFLVEYEDSDRNVFNLSSKSDSDDVKSSFLIGPVLMGYKNASKDRLVLGDTFKLELVVENIGNEPASARIFDLNKSWEFTLLPGRKRSLTFDYIADVTGRYEIPGAVIKYSSLNETYTTISNSVSVRVSAPEEAVVEEPPAIFVFAQERLKINPLATLVLITLVILTSVVAWIYFKESRQYKKPLKYSEKEKKWVRY